MICLVYGLPWEGGAALRQERRRAGCTAQGTQAKSVPSADAGAAAAAAAAAFRSLGRSPHPAFPCSPEL